MEETKHQRAARLNQQEQVLNEQVLLSWESRRNTDSSFLSKVICGYVIDRGGPHGLDIEKPIFTFSSVHDEGTLRRRGNTTLVLTFCLGSLQWLLYSNRDVVLGKEAKEYAREKLLS